MWTARLVIGDESSRVFIVESVLYCCIIAWLSGWRLMLIARPCMLDAALPWSLGLRIFADWRVALCLTAMANGMSVHQSAEQLTISQSRTKFPQKAKQDRQ